MEAILAFLAKLGAKVIQLLPYVLSFAAERVRRGDHSFWTRLFALVGRALRTA